MTPTLATSTPEAPLVVTGVVPVIVIDDAAVAIDLADALAEGGLHCAEITLRTRAGLESIRRMAERPDFVVGAGTVLTIAEVDACADAGARFLVSPGYDDEVVERAQELGIAVLPGIATATELQRAVRAGLDAVKVFPAEILGGVSLISALAAPFPGVRFMPSGGIDAGNAAAYLAAPSVFAIGGSWMATRELISNRRFDEVAERSRLAMALV